MDNSKQIVRIWEVSFKLAHAPVGVNWVKVCYSANCPEEALRIARREIVTFSKVPLAVEISGINLIAIGMNRGITAFTIEDFSEKAGRNPKEVARDASLV